MLYESREHDLPALPIHFVRRLIHPPELRGRST
jgi:hypothetical protein